jgi:hypothetical protein
MKNISSQPLHSLALGLILTLATGAVALTPMPAHAIWASEITQGMNYAKLLESTRKLKEQYDKLQEQLKMVQKQYDQLNPGNFDLGSVTGFRDDNADFKERGINEGDEVCDKGRSSVGKEQYAVCVKTVQVRNMRFNAMVKMLKDVAARDKDIKKLMDDRKTLNGPENSGKLLANTNAIARLQTQMENDIQNGKYTLDTYTAILTTLNDDMVALAERALTGKAANKKGPFGLPPIVGTVLQGAALKIALAGAGTREL